MGLAYAKDLMGAERDGLQDAPVGDVVRPARFVPETKRVPDMLREMQRDKFHMAIAVDEYGGTAGLVTLEDIIEELVGEIVDEFDVDDPIVEPLPGGGIRVHGRTPLDQVNDILGARLPEGDWDTIGGLVYDRVGHVPVEGETVRVAGWHLTAQRIQGRRIGRVSITPEPRAADRPGGEAGTGAGATLPAPGGATGEPAPADAPPDTTGDADASRRAATNGLGGDAPDPAAGAGGTSRPGRGAEPPRPER
jgi:Mg2+/Co2+ transporter CorC